jgi:hypothetical protein
VSKPNDGGPAFPALYPVEDETGRLGMSLRDWFAGQALAGILANPALVDVKAAKWVASYAYEIADTMLAERDKPRVTP